MESVTGYTCPECGWTESFTADSVRISGRVDIGVDGWDWSHGGDAELPEGTRLRCGNDGCAHEGAVEEFLGDGPGYPAGSYARAVGGVVEVLCFDRWSDGLVEAWTVSLPPEDFAWQVRAAREGALCCAAQDLLAGYDSEHFDAGTAGFLRLAAEVARGEWAPLAPLEAPLPARAVAPDSRRLDFGGTGFLHDFVACADVPEGWLGPEAAGDYRICTRAYDTSALEGECERVAQAAGLAYDCFVWVDNAVTGDLEDIARFFAEDRVAAEAALEAAVEGLAQEQVREAATAIERRLQRKARRNGEATGEGSLWNQT